MLLHGLTIFLSAFLLFQVQPLIAKTILAWFGGSAAVWTTCMLFFQVLLLAGYFYSHVLVSRLAARGQFIIHSLLLLAAAVSLPITPSATWKPVVPDNPTWQILTLLVVTVGLPYFACSTTGPLIQAWYAREAPGRTPYHLFALSNAGSLLALFSYPVLVEPVLTIPRQAWVWSGGFLVFSFFCIFIAFRMAFSGQASVLQNELPPNPARTNAPPTPTEPFRTNEPLPQTYLLWMALAACPSMLMLGVTNHLTQDVASVPFLWILPLGIYLLSFILTFDTRGWYRRGLFLVVLAPALGSMAYLQWTHAKNPGLRTTMAIFAGALFIACMSCHGELALRRPAPRHLTAYYLMISIGGALGGLFVGAIAPNLFSANFELPIAIAYCGLLAWIVSVEEPGEPWLNTAFSFSSVSLLAGVLGLCGFIYRTIDDGIRGYVLVERNFYGTLRVREESRGEWDGFRTLIHGGINHGEQWTHPDRRREPITYYCADSGIGRVMQIRQEGVPHRTGVLGLGAGTLAVFGRPGDDYRFYEINPLVPRIARAQFTYLPDSRAHVEVVMGDARLSLEREPSRQFDVLMMDAFSGDSIPVHLATREAFELYFRHLKPDGIIVIHISNKYLNLEPVIARIAEALHKAAWLVESDESNDGNCFGTTYVLLANSPEIFARDIFRGGRAPASRMEVAMWTDNYSNLVRILK